MQISTERSAAAIRALLSENNLDDYTLEALPQQGSNRKYFRVTTAAKNYICTYSENVEENETFFHYAKIFHNNNIPVPALIAINADRTAYIQEDFGDNSLFSILQNDGHSPYVFELYVKSLQALVDMQLFGATEKIYEQAYASKAFNEKAILADLFYFKYYFLDIQQITYNKEILQQEFESLAAKLGNTSVQTFMYRDFQSRNIVITDDGAPHFIDFQGGMKGAPQYDVASLLWQAKAALPDDWKSKLWEVYINDFRRKNTEPFDEVQFERSYHGFILTRLLQVLGAYGFRGLIERKSHFLTSIPQGLQNLKIFITLSDFLDEYPVLKRVMEACVSNEVIAKYQPVTATENSPLKISVSSFSYIQNGYPKDATANGGGFVFDCRGILNPGRIDEYKTQSGEDLPVRDYLENNTTMYSFLEAVYAAVDVSVENYLQRNFTDLAISFGCTGGQHRSVYAANAMAKHLKDKYNVPVTVQHLNKTGWRKTL